MQTWLTRISFFETARDLSDEMVLLQIQESRDLMHHLTVEENPDLVGHPINRMWNGYEIALAAYGIVMNIEAATRGYRSGASLTLAGYAADLQRQREKFRWPPWHEDTDILQSHRSNMVRRWPEVYDETWRGVPENMPYLWPFVDGSEYKIMVSKHDRALLASGERVLPKKIQERVANL